MPNNTVSELTDKIFDLVIRDVEEHCKLSDRLYDILSDSIGKNVEKELTHLTQQVREEEQLKALEIAKACVINRKVGSPCPLVITEKMYEQVLKVGMMGVEALSQKGEE